MDFISFAETTEATTTSPPTATPTPTAVSTTETTTPDVPAVTEEPTLPPVCITDCQGEQHQLSSKFENFLFCCISDHI